MIPPESETRAILIAMSEAISRMQIKPMNIKKASKWFEVLHTAHLSQSAVMTLPSGKSSGEKPEFHEKSEQTLFLVEGELTGEIGEQKGIHMKEGDAIVIPAGTKHKFSNPGAKRLSHMIGCRQFVLIRIFVRALHPQE